MSPQRDTDALYDLARKVCHDVGLSWTDPRTGVTYPAPPNSPVEVMSKSRLKRLKVQKGARFADPREGE